MTVRYLVQDVFQIPRRGPVVAGVLLDGEISSGDSLMVEGTGSRVRVLSVELHTRRTEAGLVVGVRLHPEDAPLVTAGSTLVSPPQV